MNQSLFRKEWIPNSISVSQEQQTLDELKQRETGDKIKKIQSEYKRLKN